MDCECSRILQLTSLEALPDHICDDVAATSLALAGDGPLPAGFEPLAAIRFEVPKGEITLWATKGGMSVPMLVPTHIPRFGEPIFVVKSVGVVPELEEAKATLHEWYVRQLLHKPLRTGRPRGSTVVFHGPEHFRAAIKAAVGAIRKQGQYPSAERVAEYLDGRPRLLGPLRGETMDARQLRRYCRRYGYRDWKAVLSDI